MEAIPLEKFHLCTYVQYVFWFKLHLLTAVSQNSCGRRDAHGKASSAERKLQNQHRK
jgi:hypothetical protein